MEQATISRHNSESPAAVSRVGHGGKKQSISVKVNFEDGNSVNLAKKGNLCCQFSKKEQ